MPIYAYRCASCGHEKDVLQKLSDAPLTQCPACGKDAFSKQVTAAGFHLKGSGWYVTDYAKSNGSSKSEGGSDAKGGSDDKKSGDKKSGSESSSSESKPAASSDSKTSSSSSSTSNTK